LIEARGLDGLAFGVEFKIDDGSADQYCAGFHNEESTDVAVCEEYKTSVENLFWS